MDKPHFFRDAEAAFTMIKTDWDDPHGHYPAVAARLFDALYKSSVEHAVNLGSFGGDVKEGTGHFVGFYHHELILDQLSDVRITQPARRVFHGEHHGVDG